MTEQVAVVEAGAAAERAHALSQLAVDQRVHHHRRTSLRTVHRQLQVVDRLDLRVPDLLEGLIRELRLERGHEARSGLAGRVRDDVQLDGLAPGFIFAAWPDTFAIASIG